MENTFKKQQQTNHCKNIIKTIHLWRFKEYKLKFEAPIQGFKELSLYQWQNILDTIKFFSGKEHINLSKLQTTQNWATYKNTWIMAEYVYWK